MRPRPTIRLRLTALYAVVVFLAGGLLLAVSYALLDGHLHNTLRDATADDLLAQVRSLQGRALAILDRAEKAGDLRTALGAIREARGNLELLAKLLGELNDAPQVNILVNPEWVSVRGVLLGALGPYPDARAAVAGALASLGAANGHHSG